MSATQIRGSTQIMDGSVTAAKLNVDADLNLNSHKITGLANGTNPGDAVNKSQLDAVSAGLDTKQSVRVGTTANITLSGTQTIDGIALSADDRVLVKNQTAGAENGIYTVASGAWSRSTDADSNTEVTPGMYCFIEEGTTLHDTGWILTNDGAINLGTTVLVFTQFNGGETVTAGDGLSKSGTTLNVGAGDGITVGTDTITVKLETDGGLQVDSSNKGLEIKLDGSSLSLSSNGLKLTDGTYLALAKIVKRETPTGTINGSNTSFTLANTPVSGTEEVYLNGILQEPGSGNDYTISSGTITMLSAPIAGDKLRVSYISQ